MAIYVLKYTIFLLLPHFHLRLPQVARGFKAIVGLQKQPSLPKPVHLVICMHIMLRVFTVCGVDNFC